MPDAKKLYKFLPLSIFFICLEESSYFELSVCANCTVETHDTATEQALCNGRVSVRLCVCSIYQPLQQHAAGLLLVALTAADVEGPAATSHSSTAVSSKCEQCHVYSRRRRLNSEYNLSAERPCYSHKHERPAIRRRPTCNCFLIPAINMSRLLPPIF